MATMALENINPYSKIGLRRRPTYDEITNLIPENETLTGKIPDRTATMFKASPEGSFFDGLNHLEILKKQQNRILERQMRELLSRQNLGGSTYSVSRLRTNQSENTPPQPETQSDSNIGEATMEAQLQERARQFAERQQQTGQAHQGLLSRASTPSVVRRIFSNLSSPDVRQSIPRQVTPPEADMSPEVFTIGGSSSSEGEPMETARGEPDERQIKVNYSTNISNMSVEALKIQLFLRGIDVDDPEYSLEGMRRKGKGKGLTEKQYYSNLANELIQNGQWQEQITSSQLMRKIEEYKNKSVPRGSKD